MALSKEQIEKLLGRTLNATESSNFSLYLDIAVEKANELLCLNLCGDGGERSYALRPGYSDLYIDPFYSLKTVVINGVETENHTVKQNDSLNGKWFNIIEFDSPMCEGTATVNASWGFNGCMPLDLQLLVARLFDMNSSEQKFDLTVKSKKIEDFSITYADNSKYDAFLMENQETISKYSQCNVNQIRNGRIRTFC